MAHAPVNDLAAVPRAMSGGRALVLVVEDEHLVALDIQLRLSQMGYRARVVHNAADALREVERSDFAVVLMDIRLRGALDGVDAAREIGTAHDIPVIYLTAYADAVTVERARQTEPYGYLLKPFQDRELEATILVALHRHAAERQRREQHQIQQLLAEVSTSASGSLDYRAVARRLIELLVPQLADWALIHLRERDGFPAFTLVSSEPGTPADVTADARAINDVEDRRVAHLLTTLSDRDAMTKEFGSGCVASLECIPASSAMCVPLVHRDAVLGSLCVAASTTRTPFVQADVALLSDIAQRLAIALDNALLYWLAGRAIDVRDDVLAVVSHDLRGPLMSIMLQAQSLEQAGDIPRVAKAIVRSSKRMNRLLSDLLDASALDAAELPLDVRDHDARELVREACEMFASQADARAIALSQSVPSTVVHVRCDADRILQVLSNLLANALKFTHRNGSVALRAIAFADHVRFDVQDSGIGIPEEQLPHLFERFWQAQARRDGTGLGLYIAHGILAAHHVKLAVDSIVGAGTRFSFALPRVMR